MKNISIVKKDKEKKIYRIENIAELGNINFAEYVPKGAFNVEIKYVGREQILIFDYLINLSTTKEE